MAVIIVGVLALATISTTYVIFSFRVPGVIAIAIVIMIV